MPNFTFSEYGGKDRLRVVVDDQFLCTLQKHYSNNTWKIEQIGAHQEEWDTQNIGFLPTKEIAAQFVFRLVSNVEAIRHSKPLPVNVMAYLNQRAKDLREEKQRLNGQLIGLQIERQRLLQLAKEYGVDFATYMTDDVDQDKILKQLAEFEIVKRNKSVPFFSETALYSLIGKDNARTLLGYMRTLAQFVSPDQEYF